MSLTRILTDIAIVIGLICGTGLGIGYLIIMGACAMAAAADKQMGMK